jgi:hypothetical protein
MTTGKTPILEKDQKRDGWFRRIDSEVQSIDWLNTESEEIRVEFPFGISRLVKILPKNIIVVAGAMDAGKTAFLLNFVAKNSDRFKGRMHYFSSEMGPLELKTRLEKFPGQLEYWKDKFYFYERSSNFADMIKPDDINIIDYLELSGAEGSEFTKAGYFIRQIFDKLNNGIALIAIQKKRGIDLGRGAELTAEKARLYLSLDSGKVKIVKAKNWRTSDNPNNKYKTYKLVDGCKIQEITKDWIKED